MCVSSFNKKNCNSIIRIMTLDFTATDCSANKIFKAFKESLEKQSIFIKIIVGLACDNESVILDAKILL